MAIHNYLADTFRRFLVLPEEAEGPERYNTLRRSFCALMLVITLVPLVLMALVNYHQYRAALNAEIVDPIKVLVNKAKHSFELAYTLCHEGSGGG